MILMRSKASSKMMSDDNLSGRWHPLIFVYDSPNNPCVFFDKKCETEIKPASSEVFFKHLFALGVKLIFDLDIGLYMTRPNS